jgi:Fe-S-cluster containining protein
VPASPDPSPPSPLHPCLRCGACCATFRCSFFWGETDANGGTVPEALVEPLTPFRVVMRGMNQEHPRCVALEGEIGVLARCGIHPLRSSVCREFPPSYEDGTPNERCDEARARWGMPPLGPGDWGSAA